jgi:hypothetical protein
MPLLRTSVISPIAGVPDRARLLERYVRILEIDE